MIKRKIKSAVSILTVAALLSTQISCSKTKISETTAPTGGAAETVLAEKDTLDSEYEEAYAAFCNVSSAVDSGSRSEAVKYAEQMLIELDDVRQELNADYQEVHAVIDTLGSNVINDRQKSYENEMNAKLDAAESAAQLIIENEESAEDGLEALRELFSEPEVEYIPTAEPSVSTKTEIDSQMLLSELTFETTHVYSAPSDADLGISVETELTAEMKELADSLGTAKAVYEYVKNNIGFETYYGSRKGAKGTYEQCGGNDTDTASLLIGMLRYLGIPARYATGTVYITAEQAVAITGASDAENAGRLLASQYKPVAQVLKNGELIGFKMTQTWTEAYVPYTDYRGAGNNSGDSVWVSLDPSFKALTVTENVLDRPEDPGVDSFDRKHSEIDEGYTASDKIIAFTREITQTSDKYLPVALPYQVVSTDSTSAAVPSGMSDVISVDVGWDSLFSLSTAELYGKNITICYVGESSYDQELIESYGGVEKVPAYLVNVVPAAMVGDKVYTGDWGVPLGTAQQMTTYIRNRGGTSVLSDKVSAGSVYAINLDLQTIAGQDVKRSQERMDSSADSAEKYGPYSGQSLGPILDYAGKAYFAACDAYSINAEYASDVNRNRMLALAFTGYNLNAETFFGYTQRLTYGNFYIDVAYNNVTAVSYSGDQTAEIGYMLNQGAVESAYESEIWEAILGEETFGISTMSMFAVADFMGIDRILITSADVEEQLAECSITNSTKNDVRNFINQGYIVEIIPRDIKVNKWEGTAYIAYNLDTGSAAYMLSGGTAGGSSSNDVKLNKPSDNNMSVYDAIDFCFQINNLIYMINMAGALQDLYEAASLMGGSSGLGYLIAAIPAINAAKSVGEAWVMYYDNLDKYLEYAVTGSTDAAIDMLNFTIENVIDLLGDAIGELLPDHTFLIDGVEINFSDLKDFKENIDEFQSNIFGFLFGKIADAFS